MLKNYLLPRKEINEAIQKIRQDNYGIFREKESDSDFSIVNELPNLEFTALKIAEDSMFIKKSLAELDFRQVYGVTVVAIKRQEEIIEHPDAHEVFQCGDIVYVVGKPEQVICAVELFNSTGAQKASSPLSELVIDASQRDAIIIIHRRTKSITEFERLEPQHIVATSPLSHLA